jgi:hypothetical protein
MDRKSYNLILSILAALAAFIVYILTLAPSVWFIDAGELTTVASTLSIAHPTGYPFFTIIGHLFSMLPFSSSEVYKMNAMSAFFCSLGIAMFFFLMKFMISKKENYSAPAVQKKGQKQSAIAASKSPALPDLIKYALATFSCLILSFSQTYWDTANAVEVYPIHCFFAITLMFVFLKAIMETKISKETGGSFAKDNSGYLLFAFLLGLSFTNHMTTILLAPACLTLFFVTNYKDRKRMFKLLGYMAVCFIISLSLYLYLPIRANMNPILIWGNPYNLERFIWHFTAKQFTVWIFSAQGSVPIFLLLIGTTLTLSVFGLLKQKTINQWYHFGAFVIVAAMTYLFLFSANKSIADQFTKFTGSLGSEYGTGVIILALVGVYRLSKYNVTIYYFTLLAFFGCLLYSVNYDIHDIDSYFLLSYITIVIWIGFGALLIAEKVTENLKTTGSQAAFAAILLVVALIPLKTNWIENDKSKDYTVQEFAMNNFKNIEPNGIVITTQWDFWVSASWYYKYVEKMRPDIVVIDRELLRRSWYYTFLERNYPEVYNNSRPEIEKFLVLLDRFEHNLPYDVNAINRAYADLLTSVITNNPGRKIYETWEIPQNRNEPFATNYLRVPDGLLLRLMKPEDVKDNYLPDYKTYDFQFTPTTEDDYYHKTIMGSYSMMLTRSANVLIAAGRIEEAKKYLDLALLAEPNYQLAIDAKKKNNLQ